MSFFCHFDILTYVYKWLQIINKIQNWIERQQFAHSERNGDYDNVQQWYTLWYQIMVAYRFKFRAFPQIIQSKPKANSSCSVRVLCLLDSGPIFPHLQFIVTLY